MKIKQTLAGLVLAGMAAQASAVTVTTAPWAVNNPNASTSRVVWCVAQNLSKKDFSPVSTAMLGDNGTVVQTITGTVGPGKTLWLAGAKGGTGLIYCTFDVKNKNTLRTYLVVQDNLATVASIEAK